MTKKPKDYDHKFADPPPSGLTAVKDSMCLVWAEKWFEDLEEKDDLLNQSFNELDRVGPVDIKSSNN